MGGVIVPSHEIDNHVKQRLKMRRNTLPANHTTSERFVEFVSFNIERQFGCERIFHDWWAKFLFIELHTYLLFFNFGKLCRV